MIEVEIPATSANLGSGFDCVGMALDLCNTVSLEQSGETSVRVDGVGAGEVAEDASNLTLRAVRAVYETLHLPLPPVRLRLVNRIPLRRGLGSSATAIVGGLVAANALNGGPLTTEELLRLAVVLEGHPDNVGAALYGGLVISAVDDGAPVCARLSVPDGLRAVAFIPDFSMPTAQARALLPEQVDMRDAIYNLGRVGLLVAALAAGKLELLRIATQDRLHQPYRQRLFPGMPAIISAAVGAGALGAYLSGAGSTVMALVSERGNEVAAAMERAADGEGLQGQARAFGLSNTGARVVC